MTFRLIFQYFVSYSIKSLVVKSDRLREPEPVMVQHRVNFATPQRHFLNPDIGSFWVVYSIGSPPRFNGSDIAS